MSRVIGIDLTGSEKRASGIAWLNEDNYVQTARLKTDTQLINYAELYPNDIISIDSPLSLPEDPAKIYRKCELDLRRRGIGVYWCMLPSMKALTFRGINLAQELRSKGYKVIESYPGAAQDILGIPRKKKGVQFLANALQKYGIRGNLDVSHDELDAITAAIVGKLYLQGNYEMLGCMVLPRKKEQSKP